MTSSPPLSPLPSWATLRSPERPTYGPAVAALAATIGRPLMPWQRYVSDVALEVDPATGQYVYSSIVITVPRQSGKTVLYLVVGNHRALTVRLGRVWFTMQTGKDAVDWLLNEAAPLLAPLDGLYSLYRASGKEAVRWLRGGRGTFRPFNPTPEGLHSKQSDLAIVDEAWAFDPVRGRELDQAIVPTQATRPGAQVWKVSTAGTDASTWLLAAVEAGRAAVAAGKRSGTAYFEWSCPDGLDPCDAATWPLYHPAYGRTIHDPAMYAALDMLGAEEFERAYGNRWLHTTARVIPLALWIAAADAEAPWPEPGRLALAFDVALDRSDAAIVAAWRDPDGRAHIEVADHRPASSWVVDRLAELTDTWSPSSIGYDAAGPALDVADRATRAGLTVEPLNAREYATACATFLQEVIDGRLAYRPHPALDEAAGAAGRRTLGDAWAWGRRSTSVSLSALTAATSALWRADHAPAASGPFRIY